MNEVPKTLIFAKTDSHADDIIQTVREEFGQGNDFCKKVTYRTDEDPRSVLAQFRNDYHPRIAVTVDMISTGTDVKPLECLIFMRDVRSRTYFEQMKGRGTRTLEHDDLRKVTPSAATAKTHYVIVDAVGVTTSLKTASRALISKPAVPLRDLAMGVMMGPRDEDSMSSWPDASPASTGNSTMPSGSVSGSRPAASISLASQATCWRPSTRTKSMRRRVRSIPLPNTMSRPPTPWTRPATRSRPTPPACSRAS